MRRCSALLAAAALLAAPLLFGWSHGVRAQQGPGVNSGRDCQTVKSCNFTRNGAVRGCLSSFTCRTCRMVPARCTLAGRTQCREMVCSWGG